jgi:hypothetical protein
MPSCVHYAFWELMIRHTWKAEDTYLVLCKLRVRMPLLPPPPNLTATSPHKLAPRSAACLFLGYPGETKEYRCYNPDTRHVITSRHVYLDEAVYPFRSISHPARQQDPPQPPPCHVLIVPISALPLGTDDITQRISSHLHPLVLSSRPLPLPPHHLSQMRNPPLLPAHRPPH